MSLQLEIESHATIYPSCHSGGVILLESSRKTATLYGAVKIRAAGASFQAIYAIQQRTRMHSGFPALLRQLLCHLHSHIHSLLPKRKKESVIRVHLRTVGKLTYPRIQLHHLSLLLLSKEAHQILRQLSPQA